MPLIMSLEGPKLGALAEFLPGGRGVSHLPGGFDPASLAPALPVAYPHPPVLTPSQALHGMWTPFQTHSLWTIGGLLAGLWLAGTTSGQGVVARARNLTKRSK